MTPGVAGAGIAGALFYIAAFLIVLWYVAPVLDRQQRRVVGWLYQYFLIFRALRAARVVQDTLWGDVSNGGRPNKDVDAWVDVLEKRIKCLRGRDESRRNWQVDVRKRALQVAAVAIAMLEWMDTPGAKNGQP